MAKKSLAEMTNGEKYVHYKKNRNLAIAGKWASVVTPFGIIFGIKFNEYFTLVDQGETVKLTIGCILAIIVAAIAVWQDVKKNEHTKHLAPVVGWGIALLFSYLFKSIMDDLTLILAAEFAGQCGAVGLNAYAEHCSEEAKEYKKIAREDNTLGVKKTKPIKDENVEERKGNKWF